MGQAMQDSGSRSSIGEILALYFQILLFIYISYLTDFNKYTFPHIYMYNVKK